MPGTTTTAVRRRRHPKSLRAGVLALLSVLTATLAVVLPGPSATAAQNLPGGSYLFAVLEDSRLVAIDRATAQVVGTMALTGLGSAAVADIQTSPDQSTVYVVTGTSITVVDTRTMTVRGSYSDTAGSGFVSMALSPDGSRLYAFASAGWVDVVALPSLTRLGQVTVGKPASALARTVTADDQAGYVSPGPDIKVLPANGGPVVATDGRAGDLGSLVLVGNTLCVVDTERSGGVGSIILLDRSSGDVLGEIDAIVNLADAPLTAAPGGRYLYVGGEGRDPVLLRFDLFASESDIPASLTGTPGSAVAASDTGVVYVPLLDNHTQMAKVVTWPTATAITVPAAVWAVTLVDLVAAAPGAPTVTTLANGDGQVSVGFTPGTAGSSPTTGYRVTATDVTAPARGGQTATGTASPVTVPGLTNGDAYTFTVTALSADGNSAPSAPSNAITVGVPPTVSGTAPTAVVGTPYRFSFTVTGKPTPTIGIDPTTPLPAGLGFDPSTASLSGTPTSVGTTFFTVIATNALGQNRFQVQFVVNPALGSTPPPTPTPSSTTSPTPTSSGTTPATTSSHRSSAMTGSLADTGMPAQTLVAVAAALLLLGALLVATTRVRRRS
jgi:hypothetical protein